MRKGATVGNVTQIYKPSNWFESMTYSELIVERKFLRDEIVLFKRAQTSASKTDRRGMFTEPHAIHKQFNDMIKACEWGIDKCQKEMMKRMEMKP